MEAIHSVSHVLGSVAVNVDADLPRIRSIQGDLYLGFHVVVKLRNLIYVGGDVTTDTDSRVDCAHLVRVDGDLRIDGPAKLDRLTFVRRNLHLTWGLAVPKLIYIGGHLIVGKGYKLRIPRQVRVLGHIYIGNCCWDKREAFLERRLLLPDDGSRKPDDEDISLSRQLEEGEMPII